MIISGKKLEAARIKAGKSRKELAAILDRTDVRVWQIERKDLVEMNKNNVAAAAKFLGVSINQLEA